MGKIIKYLNPGPNFKYVLIIVVIASLLMVLISSKTTKLKEEKKKFFYYILVQILAFVIFSVILFNLKETTVQGRFIANQVFFLIAGCVHTYLFRGKYQKFESKKIHTEIFIAFVSSLFISSIVLVILDFYKELGFLFFYFAALLFFTIPSILITFFEAAMSIPVKLYKRWFYPLNNRYPQPNASEMNNIILLNLIFQKSTDDKNLVNFKVKAPKGFEFGRLFYYFINDYNIKHPNETIKFLDNAQEPYGWYFQTKPKWYGSSDYIDPDVSIDTNKLIDGSTIICQRI